MQRLPPILTLSDDILLYIFLHLAKRTRESFRNVVATSHVCSHWRTISLNCPMIWRQYPFLTKYQSQDESGIHEYTTTLVSRSKDLSLDAGWGTISWPWECTQLPKEFEYFHRLRSCELVLSHRNNAEGIVAALQSAQAPNLEELSITSLRACRTSNVRLLPHPMFNEDLPSLQSLFLHQCWFDIERVKMPNLRKIELRCHYGQYQKDELRESGFPLTMYQWVNILGGFTGLTSLYLTLPEFHDIDVGEPFNNPIILPRLTELGLEAILEDHLVFFEYVSAPACRRVCLDMSVDTPIPDFKPFYEKMITRFATPHQGGTLTFAMPFKNGRILTTAFTPSQWARTRSGQSAWVSEDEYAVTLQLQVFPAEEAETMPLSGRILDTWMPIVESIDTLCIEIGELEPIQEVAINSFVGKAVGLKTLVCPEASIGAVVGTGVVNTRSVGRTALNIIPYVGSIHK